MKRAYRREVNVSWLETDRQDALFIQKNCSLSIGFNQSDIGGYVSSNRRKEDFIFMDLYNSGYYLDVNITQILI